MAVAFVRQLSTQFVKAAGTILNITVPTGTVVPPGNLIVARYLFDNAATASKPVISSITKPAGETNSWVFLGAARSTSTSAGAFASGEMWAIRTSVEWEADINYVATLDVSVTMRAAQATEFSGVLATLRGVAGTAYSTTTSAASAATSGTPSQVGDLAVGFIFGSNVAAAQAGSTNTGGGSWSAVSGFGSTGGSGATNNFGVAQYKILTSASSQLYQNSAAMTAGNGSIVAILQPYVDPAITQAASRFYADGVENSPVLVDSYPVSNRDGSNVLNVDNKAVGQSFTGTGAQLARLGFDLNRTGTATGSASAAIYTHTGTFGTNGVPGTLLATSTTVIDPMTVSTSPVMTYFDFDGSLTLVNGTRYFAVLQNPTASTAAGLVYGQDTSAGTAPGNPALLPTSTGVWATASYDMIYEVYRTDDSTALAAQDTTPTIDVDAGDVNLQLRTRLQSVPGLGPPTLLDTYPSTNYSSNDQIATSLQRGWAGQQFLGDGSTLTRAGFRLHRATVGDGVITAALYASTSNTLGTGTPTGSPLATSLTTVDVTTLPATSNSAWTYFDFTGTQLTNGVAYYVVVKTTNTVAGGVCVGLDFSTPTHAGNYCFWSGSSWTTTTSDLIFEVYSAMPAAAVTVDPSDDFQLQWEKNASGTWTDLATPSGVLMDSYSSANADFNIVFGAANASQAQGQSFTGDGKLLTRAAFYLKKTATPNGTVTARLYAHTGTYGGTGTATGSALAVSNSIASTALSTSSTMVYFDFDGTVTLTNGTRYVIAVESTNNLAVGNDTAIGMDASTPTHAGNRSSRSSGAWTGASTEDIVFEVYTASPGDTAAPYNSPNLTDGAPTSNRLTGGTGTFTPGKISEDGLVDNLGWPGNNHTELLYSLTLKKADLSNSDTIRFRVLRNGATTGLTYTQTPTLTIAKTPVALSQAAYRFYADGTETASTALAAQDAAPTVDMSAGDTPLQLRTRLQSMTVASIDVTDDFQLQWEKNASGTWAAVVGASGNVLLDSYASSNQSAAQALWAETSGIAQSFLGDGKELRRARFWLRRVNTPDGSVSAALWASSGPLGSEGTPTGTPIAVSSTSYSNASLGTAFAFYDFDFPPGTTLGNGTTYFIGVTSTVTTNSVEAGTDNTPTHPGESAAYDVPFEGWLGYASDMIFEVYTASSLAVIFYDSPNLTDAAPTTNRLTGGTGSFTAGKVSEDGLVDNLGWAGNNHTELLYSLALKQVALANGDTLRFRVLRNGATTDLTYTQYPTLTIGGGVPPTAPMFDVWTGSAWVKKPVKTWNGSAWVEKPIKRWNGSSWVTI